MDLGSKVPDQPILKNRERRRERNSTEPLPEDDASSHSVYSSAIFLFLCPCFLLFLAILLSLFTTSRDLLRFILWLLLKILLCPLRILMYLRSFFCRRRRATGGTKPVTKKPDQKLVSDCVSETKATPFDQPTRNKEDDKPSPLKVIEHHPLVRRTIVSIIVICTVDQAMHLNTWSQRASGEKRPPIAVG